jgi:hypothetical protein
LLVALRVPVIAIIAFRAAIFLPDEDALLATRKIPDAVEAVRPEDGVAGYREAVPRGVGIGDAEFPDPAEAGDDLVFEYELVSLGSSRAPRYRDAATLAPMKSCFHSWCLVPGACSRYRPLALRASTAYLVIP